MVFAFPWVLIAGFGRFGEMFSLAAQACAAVQGVHLVGWTCLLIIPVVILEVNMAKPRTGKLHGRF